MTNVEKFNNQNLGEEIANAVSHGIGVLLSLAGTVILIVAAAQNNSVIGVVSSSIYGFSLINLFLMSTLYHSFTNKTAKKVFQVLDHCSIFLLILGSYTPICLALVGGAMGWTLFGVNAFFAVTGIVFNAINVKRWHKISLVVYILMGWSVIFVGKPLLSLIPLGGWVLLVGGGLCYSIGILFYKASHPRFMHSVWHVFVLGGAILHYFFMLFYIIR